MKIGIISDIHIDRNKDFPITELLLQRVLQKQLDCLVIAGDISNHFSLTLRFVDDFASRAGIPVYFVPGNHDIWNEAKDDNDTQAIYQRYQQHPCCLIGKSIPLVQEWVLVGDIGWYDYSFGDATFTQQDFEKKQHYGRTWMDSVHVNWHQTDAQVHRLMLANLQQQFNANPEKKIIAVTHMVTNANFTVPRTRAMWDYFNAFLGSAEYGKLYEQYDVRYSVMGHVHYRAQSIINGVDYICSCLNYHSEWQSGDCSQEIDEALTILTLQ